MLGCRWGAHLRERSLISGAFRALAGISDVFLRVAGFYMRRYRIDQSLHFEGEQFVVK